MRMLLAAVLAFAFAPMAARAQTQTDSYAASLIAAAEAEDLFDIVPGEDQAGENLARVRHRASGLVCLFGPGRSNQLHVFPSLDRGEDVACDSTAIGEAQTIYATRYPGPTTLEDQLDGAVAAIRARIRNLQPMQATMDIVPEETALPDQLSARFTYAGPNGIARYTRVSVAMVDGWVIKLRYTADAPEQNSLAQQDLMASFIWFSTLERMTQAPKS
jgi:hypothetical protein